MKRKQSLFFAFVLMAMVSVPCFGKVNIKELSGSDLGLGVGARAVSVGGAFAALADDITAVFWNPAGLTQLDHNEAAIMMDNPAKWSFRGIVFRPFAGGRDPYHLAVAYSRTNRLTYDGEGDWSTDLHAGHLVDLSMINLPRNPDNSINYNGGINSRTNDERYTLAFNLPKHEKLSIGVSYIDFKCVTTFYGLGAGRACQIVSYKTMDMGFLYKDTAERGFGLMFRNVLEQSKPRYITAAYSIRRGKRVYMVDVERITGNYEEVQRRKANFLFLRAGMESYWTPKWKWRAGIILPLIAKTSTLGNLRSQIPAPYFGGAIGAGYENKNFKFDIALFGDPARSYIENQARFNYTFTAIKKF